MSEASFSGVDCTALVIAIEADGELCRLIFVGKPINVMYVPNNGYDSYEHCGLNSEQAADNT